MKIVKAFGLQIEEKNISRTWPVIGLDCEAQ